VDGTVAQSMGVDSMDRGGVVDKGGGVVEKGGSVVNKGSMVEEGVGDDLMGHLGGHLNDRLDERGMSDGVGHREDGGSMNKGKRGSKGKGSNRVCKVGSEDRVVRCKDGGRGGKVERVGGEGEGVGVGGVGEQDRRVGFRPCQAKRGNGENSNRAHHAVC